MQNILVTGGAGFIGSNFVRYLLKIEPGVRIINLDALTYAGSQENLKDLPAAERHIFVQGNICDPDLLDKLLRQHQIETIVHFAAESHVDRSILGPGQFVETNIIGTFTLLEAARKYWLVDRALPFDSVRFHHISTDEVFGSLAKGEPAWTEETPYAPNSPYAASKASSDHLVRSYGHTYGLPFSLTNCSNNYGPYQFPEKLIHFCLSQALEGKPIPIYGQGANIRDWIFVEDHCQGLLQVLAQGRVGETYNIGGRQEVPNLELVRRLLSLLGEMRPDLGDLNRLITLVADRPGHDWRYALNIDKIESRLGWRPQVGLEEGLRRTIAWYLGHEDWLNRVRSQEYRAFLTEQYGTGVVGAG